MKLLLFILLLSASCATKKDGPSEKTQAYIKSWKEDYQVSDPSYISAYTDYISMVEKIFLEHHAEKDFEAYLSSVRNSLQLLSHTEFLLPQRYKKEKGRHGNPTDYENYKKKQLFIQRLQLDKERMDKLRKTNGDELVAKLIQLQKSQKYYFPL